MTSLGTVERNMAQIRVSMVRCDQQGREGERVHSVSACCVLCVAA